MATLFLETNLNEIRLRFEHVLPSMTMKQLFNKCPAFTSSPFNFNYCVIFAVADMTTSCEQKQWTMTHHSSYPC